MTETKYAGLPGIVRSLNKVNEIFLYLIAFNFHCKAYDQPDVYESEDIPETDQDMTPRVCSYYV